MNNDPNWKTLYLIGLVAVIGLLFEAGLPVSSNAHHILLLVWVVVVFGAMAFWINVDQLDIERSERKHRTKSAPVEEWFDEDRIQLQQAWDDENETEVM